MLTLTLVSLQKMTPHSSQVGFPNESWVHFREGVNLPGARRASRPPQEPLGDTSDDPTDALRAMDRLAENGLTTFQLGNGAGGGRALAERRAGSFLKSVR